MRRRNLLENGNLGLTLSSNSGTVAISGITSFTVNYNGVPLTASSISVSSNQSWVTTAWTASSSTVKLTCSTNTSLSNDRYATITVSYSGQSVTYSLTQSHGTYFTLSPSSSTVEPSDGGISVYLYINGTYWLSSNVSTASVSTSGQISGSSRYSSYIQLRYKSNTSTSSTKSGSATITYQGYSRTFSLTQKADYVVSSSTTESYRIVDKDFKEYVDFFFNGGDACAYWLSSSVPTGSCAVLDIKMQTRYYADWYTTPVTTYTYKSGNITTVEGEEYYDTTHNTHRVDTSKGGFPMTSASYTVTDEHGYSGTFTVVLGSSTVSVTGPNGATKTKTLSNIAAECDSSKCGYD